MNNGRIVGAILLGNQELADPLRRLIENEADLSHIQSILLDDKVNLPQALQKAWRDWHENW
jgi:NAD(P)H-nitrite reductase large subunit